MKASEPDGPRTGRAGEILVRGRQFSDASPGVATDGEIEIGADTVTFRAGDAVTELPVAGLGARFAGFDDRTLFLSHPSQPGIDLATTDPRAIAAPAIAALPSLAASRVQGRARRRRFWGCAGAAALALAVALVAIVAAGGWLLSLVQRLFG
ncbi:MAG TPA: hypothetical protein VMV46_08185 [Thermoanaerobaculia bacterium]|nr:hypothetical protein [Thermoanaerobaculia bacterium]